MRRQAWWPEAIPWRARARLARIDSDRRQREQAGSQHRTIGKVQKSATRLIGAPMSVINLFHVFLLARPGAIGQRALPEQWRRHDRSAGWQVSNRLPRHRGNRPAVLGSMKQRPFGERFTAVEKSAKCRAATYRAAFESGQTNLPGISQST